MTLKPLRGYVLILPSDEDEVTASGLIMPERSKDKPSKGKVVAVGEPPLEDIGLLLEYKYVVKRPYKKGDMVIYHRWSGTEIKDGDKDVLLVKFDDLQGIYED